MASLQPVAGSFISTFRYSRHVSRHQRHNTSPAATAHQQRSQPSHQISAVCSKLGTNSSLGVCGAQRDIVCLTARPQALFKPNSSANLTAVAAQRRLLSTTGPWYRARPSIPAVHSLKHQEVSASQSVVQTSDNSQVKGGETDESAEDGADSTASDGDVLVVGEPPLARKMQRFDAKVCFAITPRSQESNVNVKGVKR